MQKLAVALALLAAAAPLAPRAARAQRATPQDLARWQREARNVTIVRDDWGIPHVYGKTDADAVFGVEYAQAEDDFNRVETNYINGLGWLAQTEGESAIWQDLRQQLFISTDSLKAQYAASPAWLRSLMDAFADGLNYYLYTHPDIKPRVINHFEPWMALSFTEGSIGGDIERVNLRQLAAFYGAEPRVAAALPADPDATVYREPTGSNGISIAPSNTIDHHALLLINPHTSFFFRAEAQMVSDEGLDAYGAITWGQFFIYQGFNPRLGWMHTSSGVDAIDEYLETISRKGDRYYYKYGNEERPVATRRITVPYRTTNGVMAERTFTAYFTKHGPVIREDSGRWVSIALMQEPIKALTQSYMRTKARTLAEYEKTMALHANSSNNTLYADADGHIAYFHANFIPRRDPHFDWTKPVDGSNPATDWHGLLSFAESPNVIDPPNGWVYNSNNAPWSAAGPYSPKKANFPAYVDNGGESWRGLHALRVLTGRKDFSIQGLRAAAFDSYLPAFAAMIPALVKAYDRLPATDSMKPRLAPQIQALRGWDFRWSVSSVPTALAVYYGEALGMRAGNDFLEAELAESGARTAQVSDAQQLQALAAASDRLTREFGSWRTPWGQVNRFQRLTGAIEPQFIDAAPSIPVGFTSSRWGSLASFGARPYPGTDRWYGTSGNSFVAVVQFGDSVRAIAVTAGGESGHPRSRHFDDQAERYATGNLRPVYFYRSQLTGHTEREYHPGS